MPRYKDGLFQENISENAYINRLLGFIKIGAIPEALKNIYLEFTPIDICANSIINLVAHPNENNRIFHLFNNNSQKNATAIAAALLQNEHFQTFSLINDQYM